KSGMSPLPLVAQLAQLDEHGTCVGFLADLREFLAQPRDDLGVLQPEEGVDALLLAERGDTRGGRILRARRGQRVRGLGIAGLPVEREAEVARHVLVSWVYARGVG